MLKLSQTVVVEGKYDQIRLSSLLDAAILPVGGFQIYHDKETLALIRRLACECGIIILTDSDAAGFQIRSFLRSAVREGKVYHAYIPDRYGKEKRKPTPSAEGKLGVEGMPDELLLDAIRRSGALEDTAPQEAFVTRTDLYLLGLSGRPDSAKRRRAVLTRLGLPQRLSAAQLCKMITLRELQALLNDEKEEASCSFRT